MTNAVSSRIALRQCKKKQVKLSLLPLLLRPSAVSTQPRARSPSGGSIQIFTQSQCDIGGLLKQQQHSQHCQNDAKLTFENKGRKFHRPAVPHSGVVFRSHLKTLSCCSCKQKTTKESDKLTETTQDSGPADHEHSFSKEGECEWYAADNKIRKRN